MVRDARRCRAPHHEGSGGPHPEERALRARLEGWPRALRVLSAPLICPTGKSSSQSPIGLSSPSAKNILIFRRRKSVYIRSRSVPQRGARAIVTNAGRMRWTQAAPKDDRRRRGRRSRVVLDTQCRCRRWLAGLVRRGEHEGIRKTIARGMPGETGVTVVTTLVCFVSQTACEAAGASDARHSLRPLFFEGRRIHAQLGRLTPRECSLPCAIAHQAGTTKVVGCMALVERYDSRMSSRRRPSVFSSFFTALEATISPWLA
jgi:hypothetical protein